MAGASVRMAASTARSSSGTCGGTLPSVAEMSVICLERMGLDLEPAMTDEKVGRDYDCDLPFSSLRISFESSRSITWYWCSPVWADTMRSHFLAFSEVFIVTS